LSIRFNLCERAIRKPDLWYHDGDHAVLMRSNLVCHDVRFDPIQTKYATDLTDEQWAAIAPLVAAPSPNGGRPIEIDRRAIVNALLYKHRTGCQWRMLPNASERCSANEFGSILF
jgi:hypothetical protein